MTPRVDDHVPTLQLFVERAIERAVFGGECGRRQFMARVGKTTAAAASRPCSR